MDERAYARYMADVAYFITRMEQNPDSKYFMPVALAYNKMEKYDNTIELCRKAIERFPAYCPVKTLLAEAYIYKGEAATAKPLLFDVITEDPENYKALKLLGMIYRSTDETGEALKYFKAAYIRAPEDEDVKHAIEDLGGSISPDDLFAEFMKKNQDALWSNTDERSYKDIDQHIRSAEVMMTDLVADTKIADNLTSENVDRVSGDIPDISAISEAELDKLLGGGGETTPSSSPQPQTVPVTSTSSSNVSDAISDDELNKLFANANSPITQTAATQPATTNESVQRLEKEIESSDDYSALESILDIQAVSDKQDATDTTNMEISDVLSALESSSDGYAEETSTEWDKSGAFNKTSTVENVAESFTPFTGGYAVNAPSVSEVETQRQQKPVPNAPEVNSDNQLDVSYNETFILDEEALNSMQGFSDVKTQEATATQAFAEDNIEGADPRVKKTGKIIENFTFIESDDVDEVQADSQQNPPESVPPVVQMPVAKSATEFKLEDMIGDDREDRENIHAGEEDLPSRELGEAVPFTQQDILDEILSASSPEDDDDEMEGLESLPENDRYGDKERTVEKLLKLQSRLDTLKKG